MPAMSAQSGDPTTPAEVVQAQLDAYNAQNNEAFAAVFASDALVYHAVGDTEPRLKGRKSIRQRYADLFKQYPQNKSTLLCRIVQGDYVIDHEWITGREEETRIVAIYEVRNGLITRCWFVR
jgi:uncharacterized protein (TIGR02246 family)